MGIAMAILVGHSLEFSIGFPMLINSPGNGYGLPWEFPGQFPEQVTVLWELPRQQAGLWPCCFLVTLPTRFPIAVPMEIPMGRPMGFPVGLPVTFRVGIHTGISMALPTGLTMGTQWELL